MEAPGVLDKDKTTDKALNSNEVVGEAFAIWTISKKVGFLKQ